MKYKAQFKRTETYLYFVEVEADTIEEAKEKAGEFYSDCDLDSLEHYCLDGNDWLETIEEHENE